MLGAGGSLRGPRSAHLRTLWQTGSEHSKLVWPPCPASLSQRRPTGFSIPGQTCWRPQVDRGQDSYEVVPPALWRDPERGEVLRVVVSKMEQLHNQQLALKPFTRPLFQALSSVALEQSVSYVGSRCGPPVRV